MYLTYCPICLRLRLFASPGNATGLGSAARRLVGTGGLCVERFCTSAPLSRAGGVLEWNMATFDFCDLGGWKSRQTVLSCYVRPDEKSQRTALEERPPKVAIS